MPGAGSATTSPTARYTAIITAAGQQQSFRATSVQSGCACGNTDRISQVTDVATNQGSQQITYTSNGQTGHVTVLVTGGNAYVLGDAFALTNYMGYKPDAAASYSNQWIQIPPTDPDFRAVSTDVTLSSSVGDLYLPLPVSLSPNRSVNGRVVIGVMGTTPATTNSPAATVSLYARATGIPLPVEEDIVRGNYSAGLTFSHWNERLRIVAPANATPISTTGLE